MHRPRPGEKEGLWTERGDLRGFPRDFCGLGTEETPPQGACHVYTARYPPLAVGDNLAPTHPPSASVCFLEPGTRLAVRGGGGVTPEGTPVLEPGTTRRLESARWQRTGGRTGRRTLRGRLFGGRREMGLHGPSPLTRGKPRLQKLDALAGRSFQSGWRCLMPTHLALLEPSESA